MKHSLTQPTPASLMGLADRVAPCEPTRHDERSSALKPSLLERIERALWRSRQRELERALEGATDAADLEAKLRRIEGRMLYRYY